MRAYTIMMAVVLTACEDGRPAGWERERAITGPIPLKDAVAYVDSALDRVVLVDAASGSPRVSTVAVGRRPRFAVPAPDGRSLVVATRGLEALYEGEVDEAPGLYVVPLGEAGVAIRYELGSAFDRVAVSPDGSVALAWFSAGGADEDGLFRNPNELAVVDLLSPPGEGNPVLRTIRSFGAAPIGAVLSPPMTIPGTDAPPRTLAFVLAADAVTILDASSPQTREVTIRLSLDGAGITPRELAFAPRTGSAYVRADGASDILEIVMSAEEPRDAEDNDFQPALAELGAGAAPADIAVYDDIDERRRVVAVTPATRELAVIDADTAAYVTVPIDDPVDRILLLPEDQPRVAVLATLATRAPRVHIVALDQVGGLLPVDVRTLSLAAGVWDVVPIPGQERALIVHDEARTVIGVLDVAGATVAPLEGIGRLDTYDFTAGGTFLVGATLGEQLVGFVEMSSLHPFDVRLDDTPRTVHALASGGIWIDHDDAFGRATFLPSPAGGRADAVVLSGFLVQGLLEETP